MRRLTLLITIFAAITFATTGAPTAQADYAVLRSGVRLHITGYERAGEVVRLSMDGGSVEVQASDLVSVEPEDHFAAQPTLAPANGPFGNLIRAAALKHGVDEKLITHLIEVESNFNPRAVSRKQAQGLMQLIPETDVYKRQGKQYDDHQRAITQQGGYELAHFGLALCRGAQEESSFRNNRIALIYTGAVSYTHLDVYKRQKPNWWGTIQWKGRTATRSSSR